MCRLVLPSHLNINMLTFSSPETGVYIKKVEISRGKDLQFQKTVQSLGSASWKSWGVAVEVRQTT